MPKDSKESLSAKITIIERSIEEDQKAIAYQWLSTFKHNELDNAANCIAKLMLACVAKGEFKTRSSLLSTNELSNPTDTLSVVDYLSHASRIILDYQGLSKEHKEELLAFFPQAGEHGVVSRSATHAVIREDNKINELKGFMFGFVGQLRPFVKKPYDFGINIAMGGEGQINLIGKTISANGFSGHMYFHHYAPHELLMLGLEQSAPASSFLEAIWGHPTHMEDVQSESDQFGQCHSLTGASDVYTAAGSLYFSDPVYQAKLLAETGSAPPDKYGAMQITLNDENWLEIQEYLAKFNYNLESKSDNLVLEQLLLPPAVATDISQEIGSYIALDFKTYLQRISLLLQLVDENQREAIVQKHTELQIKLFDHIKALQGGAVENYKDLKQTIEAICTIDSTPESYILAIKRIQVLFECQLKIDKKLESTHIHLLSQQRCSELLDSLNLMLEKAQLLHSYFIAEHISKENGVGKYLTKLEEHLLNLEQIKDVLLAGKVPLDHEIANPLEKSLIEQRSLEDSWLDTTEQSGLQDLDFYQEKISEIEQFLQETPRLVSESTLKKAQAANQILTEEIHHLKDDILCLENKLEILKNTEVRQSRELIVTQDELTETKDAYSQLQRDMQLLSDTTNQKLKESAAKITELTQKIEQSEKTQDSLAQTLIGMAPVLAQLKQVKEQSTNLKRRGYHIESDVALRLTDLIKLEIEHYLSGAVDSPQTALKTFQKNCETHIQSAAPILEKHRGWKRLIGNLLACILGLGVGYVVAGAINKYVNGHFLFFNETKSISKLSKLKTTLDDFSNHEEEQSVQTLS